MITFTTQAIDNLSNTLISEDGSTVVCLGLKESPFKGKMDEVRLSTGIVRKTIDFTPPSEAYTIYGMPASAISGLTHLNGKTVSILSDGVVQTQQVVSNGTITLTDAAALVHIGLPYNSDLETLNIELPLNDGTMQGQRVLISRVIMRMLNSRGGYTGPDFSDMYELTGEYKTSTDDSLYTGDVKLSLNQGYKDGGRFCVRQSDPLPMTILGVLPILTPGGTSGT